MRDFHFTEDFVLYDLPSLRGWAYLSGATLWNPHLNVRLADGGYIRAEIERLLSENGRG
jgi:hypothetical protein